MNKALISGGLNLLRESEYTLLHALRTEFVTRACTVVGLTELVKYQRHYNEFHSTYKVLESLNLIEVHHRQKNVYLKLKPVGFQITNELSSSKGFGFATHHRKLLELLIKIYRLERSVTVRDYPALLSGSAGAAIRFRAERTGVLTFQEYHGAYYYSLTDYGQHIAEIWSTTSRLLASAKGQPLVKAKERNIRQVARGDAMDLFRASAQIHNPTNVH